MSYWLCTFLIKAGVLKRRLKRLSCNHWKGPKHWKDQFLCTGGKNHAVLSIYSVVRGEKRHLVISKSTIQNELAFGTQECWGIFTPCFKVTTITPSKVEVVFTVGFTVTFSHIIRQNEIDKSTFILVIKLFSWDKKQTKNTQWLNEIRLLLHWHVYTQVKHKYDTIILATCEWYSRNKKHGLCSPILFATIVLNCNNILFGNSSFFSI